MSLSEQNADSSRPAPREFRTTHWSVVLLARGGDTVGAEPALAELCKLYWYPLYAYVRRLGRSAEDAQDLTQEFFARLIEKRWLDNVDRARGKFRSFLLTAFKHFLASEWHRDRAFKRGGGQTLISLDSVEAEDRYKLEPTDTTTPETLYDRRWALTVLDRAIARLETEQSIAGHADRFEAVKGLFDWGAGRIDAGGIRGPPGPDGSGDEGHRAAAPGALPGVVAGRNRADRRWPEGRG